MPARDSLRLFVYEDLLFAPYKINGRDVKTGLDCYGLLLECYRRCGLFLPDVLYCGQQQQQNIKNFMFANVKPTKTPSFSVAVVWNYGQYLHCGFMLDASRVLNMCFSGAKITPLFAIKNYSLYSIADRDSGDTILPPPASQNIYIK